MRVFLQIGLILVSLLTAGEVFAQSSAVAKQETQSIVEIDASKVPGGPVPLSFATGGRSPGGHVLSANSQYLTLDGTPWFPVMGEFHFTRYSEADWEEEILKMKAGGDRKSVV